MNRGRRLASIVVIASLGLGSLAGCQTENGKAAFVGDTTISEERVSQVYDDVVAKTPKQQPAPDASGSPAPDASASPAAAAGPPVSRQQVVDLLVSLELARRVVREKNMPPAKEPTQPAEIADALRVAGDSEFVKLWAEWLDLQTVITENTPRQQLTDAGIMKVYDALVKVKAIQPGLPVAQVREQFGAAIFAESAILVSTSLGAEAEETDTKVNPKYDPVSAPMAVGTQSGPIFYDLPYLSSDMVTDVSL